MTTELEDLRASWLRSLRARNLSAATQATYGAAASQFLDWADGRELHDPQRLRRAHIEEFMGDLLDRTSAATAHNRYRALQQWFKWMTEEDIIDRSPMERMKAPMVPEQPVDVLTLEQCRAVLKGAEGSDFESRRDMAILRLFMDTGMRRAELAGLKVSDIDFEMGVAVVLGKNRRDRACPFGPKTSQALERFLRVRKKHALVQSPGLWLGVKNRPALLADGIAAVVQRRGDAAGIPGLHPHQLRHTAVNEFLAADGGETNAMRLYGWTSRQMLSRYAASAADDRARKAHQRLSLGDRL